jgi:hypothetical protein
VTEISPNLVRPNGEDRKDRNLLIAPIETSDAQKQLLLFDGHALAFTSWFASDSVEAKNGFFRMLNAAVRKYTPSHRHSGTSFTLRTKATGLRFLFDFWKNAT